MERGWQAMPCPSRTVSLRDLRADSAGSILLFARRVRLLARGRTADRALRLRAGEALLGGTLRPCLLALLHGLILAPDRAGCALEAELPGSGELLLLRESRTGKQCRRS